MNSFPIRACRWSGAVCLAVAAWVFARADDAIDVKEELRQLRQQNQLLQEQLRQQQTVNEKLGHKVEDLEHAEQTRATDSRGQPTLPVESPLPFGLGKIILSGEGGIAFFESGSAGQYPNAEFRVDEAKLFVDAPVWRDVYFFAEINLNTDESSDSYLNVGELYLDFENVSRLWHQDHVLNIRVGRMDIPFGEEYQVRDAIDDPLITHSLSDLWGVDEGVELYGTIGKFHYTFAVQNGGNPSVHDYNADKAIIGRLAYDPTRWLHVSASAMRTGNLDVTNDGVSAMWFGGGFFRALGDPSTTTTFHADLVEGDVQLRAPRGHLKAAGGYAHVDDNDTAAHNARNLYYYYVEGLHNVTDKLYGVARFSQILAPDGYPIVGLGNFDTYFNDELTRNLWRLSLGGGYRFSPNLVLKLEYSFERGTELGGAARNHEDQFAVELALRF